MSERERESEYRILVPREIPNLSRGGVAAVEPRPHLARFTGRRRCYFFGIFVDSVGFCGIFVEMTRMGYKVLSSGTEIGALRGGRGSPETRRKVKYLRSTFYPSIRCEM